MHERLGVDYYVFIFAVEFLSHVIFRRIYCFWFNFVLEVLHYGLMLLLISICVNCGPVELEMWYPPCYYYVHYDYKIIQG